MRSRRAGQRALPYRGGRRDLAAGARGAPRLARRGFVLAWRDGAEHGLDRHRDRQSRPRMGLSPVPRSADGRGRGAVPRHDLARHSIPAHRSCSDIPTSRRRARATRANCSTGRASPAPGSGCGPNPPPTFSGGAAGGLASSSAPQRSPTSPASATRSSPATSRRRSRRSSAATVRSAGTAGSTARPPAFRRGAR